MANFEVLTSQNISCQIVKDLVGSQHSQLFKEQLRHICISREFTEDALYHLFNAGEQRND
jgi:hypothetical protein